MATGALIGALRVTLGLDTAEFEAGADKAARSAKKAEREIEATFKRIDKTADMLKGALTGFAAGFAIEGVQAAITSGLEYASALGEQAQQAGVTTDTLQEYRYVATQVGVSQDEMDAGLTKLTRTIGDAASGSKSALAPFSALGISLRDANGHVKTTDEMLPELIAKLSAIEDPTRRASLEMDLFGRAGQKLDTLLAGGTSSIDELRVAAHDLGVVLSAEQIQKADDTADKLAKLETVLSANVAGVVADNADSILSFTDALVGLVSWLGSAVKGYKTFYFWASQKLNAAGGWNFDGSELAGKAGADARARWYANDNEQQKANRPSFSWSKKQNAALDNGTWGGRGRVTPAPTAGSGKGDGAGKKHGGGHTKPHASGSGRSKADDTAINAERFAQDLARADIEQLGLKQQLTTDLRERAALEHGRIAADRASAMADIAKRVAEKKLTTAQADQLRAIETRNAEIKATTVNWQLDDALAREELSERQGALDLQRDLLQGVQQGARTEGERRTVQLRLLDLAYERERAELETVIAAHETSATEKKIAQARLDALGTLKAGDVEQVNRQTMGPLQKYMDAIPQSAAEANEAYQRIAADGLGALNDGLADAMMNSRSLGDVVKGVADQIIADLARIAIQRAITGAIGNALGGMFGGNAGFAADVRGGANAALANVSQPLARPNFTGFATGGSFTVGGVGGVDKNLIAFKATRGEMVDIRRPGQRVRSGNDNQPTVVQVLVDEGAAFVPRVAGVSGDVTTRMMSTSKRQDAKASQRSFGSTRK